MIEIGKTYQIENAGGSTYGTVTEVHEDGTFTWKSDHPEATDTHWARFDQAVRKVSTGMFLGDSGKPMLAEWF